MQNKTKVIFLSLVTIFCVMLGIFVLASIYNQRINNQNLPIAPAPTPTPRHFITIPVQWVRKFEERKVSRSEAIDLKSAMQVTMPQAVKEVKTESIEINKHKFQKNTLQMCELPECTKLTNINYQYGIEVGNEYIIFYLGEDVNDDKMFESEVLSSFEVLVGIVQY